MKEGKYSLVHMFLAMLSGAQVATMGCPSTVPRPRTLSERFLFSSTPSAS